MVLLCWARIAKNAQERLAKADIRKFARLCLEGGHVWRFGVDEEHILVCDPDLNNEHLVVYIIDYHTDCTIPERLSAAKEKLEKLLRSLHSRRKWTPRTLVPIQNCSQN